VTFFPGSQSTYTLLPVGRPTFSKAELEYLKNQRLARVATASSRGVPEVSPVGFQFDGVYFWIGSHSQDIFIKTRRYRNIIGGNGRVALVVDDLASVDPWRPRGIKVSGVAQIMDHDGMFGPGKYIRLTPRVTASWGIEPSPHGGPSVKRWGA
jgi:pyridoxamine 5'-phosphate oxidase family protein